MNYDATESEIEGLFSNVGPVTEVFLPYDRVTGRPRGFAFVEFSEEATASAAIERFDGYEFKGRPLHVREAEERQRRSSGPFDAGPSGMGHKPKKSKPKGSRRNIRARKRGY